MCLSEVNKMCPVAEEVSGDLCIFKQIDCSECLVGRVVQFSYLLGTKKQRQFSNGSVDLEKDSASNIGIYANWFYGVKPSENQDETQGDRMICIRRLLS